MDLKESITPKSQTLWVYIAWRFWSWKANLIRKLNRGSVIADTAMGPIEYQVYGEAGEYMLFFHGAPGGYDQYSIHNPTFLDKFRVISISRFGYLRTPLVGVENLPDQADALAAFLDTLNVDKVNLMAGSGGGPLALAFATYHPECVQRVVLYAAVSQPLTLTNDRPGVRALTAITRSDFLSWMIFVPLMRKPEKFVNMLIKDENNRAVIIERGLAVQFAQSISVMLPPSLRTSGMDNDKRIMKNFDVPKENMVAPTLIVHGDKDEHVAYEQSALLQRQLPNAKLITIEGGDHFMGYIHNDYLNEVYEEFFSDSEHDLLLRQSKSH